MCILADHTKWGVIGLSTFLDLADVDLLVTDSGLATRAVSALSEAVSRLDVVAVRRDAGADGSHGSSPGRARSGPSPARGV